MRQERLAAVGQLAAGVAHEFNNILTVIQGHVCLLLENPHLDKDSHKSLRQISSGVDRTAKLINQMLAFSRKQVIQVAPLDLRKTIREIADVLGRTLGEHITLRLDFAPSLPLVVADHGMIQQIIVNLAVNARDAMGDAGTLTIKAHPATFKPSEITGKSDRRPGSFVRLSVADTGSGMEQSTIDHLFEPFFTTKDVGKGSGLGLATVYGMVNQHQGWLEVQSQRGKGTTFDIFIPTARTVPPETAPENPAAPDARAVSIRNPVTAPTP